MSSYKRKFDDSTSYVDTKRQYINEILEFPVLGENETIELFEKYANGDKEARKKLIEHNLRLVLKVVNRYKNTGIPFMDLVEEGNIGLINAIDNFDINVNYKFSTYAIPAINSRILNSIRKKKNVSLFNIRPGCIDSQKESISEPITSLNISIGEEEDSCIIDFIEDKNNRLEEQIINNCLSEDINTVLKEVGLKEKDLKAIKLKFIDGKTLEEIGKIMGTSRQRIDQRISNAKRLIKEYDKKRNILKEYI